MEPLLQEDLAGRDDGLRAWRIIVASLLLKQTKRSSAEPTARAVLERWPYPHHLAEAATADVERVVKPCGMQRRRASELKAISERYAYWLDESIGDPMPGGRHGPPPKLVRTWYGCGQYIEDAVRLLVHHDFGGDPPADKELRRWYDHHGPAGKAAPPGERDAGSTPAGSIASAD